MDKAYEKQQKMRQRYLEDHPDASYYVLLRVNGDSYTVLGTYDNKQLLYRYAIRKDCMFFWVGPNEPQMYIR